LYLKGDHEKAIHAFDEGLKIDPSNPKINNNRGLALSKLERYQEAVAAFKKGGDEASAYYNLGCIYMMQGKYEESIEAFQKAIDIKPDIFVNAHENIKKAKAALPSPYFKKSNLSQ
ncbi:MAG: tetratricopeptide repeat protein, partial [Deltaproteobacteria bacterium]|nr:tetratricopeptide repeat protein [Deltaproteobacteria bacterium]